MILTCNGLYIGHTSTFPDIEGTIRHMVQELTNTGHAMWSLNQQFQARTHDSTDSSQPIHFDNSKMGEKATETAEQVKEKEFAEPEKVVEAAINEAMAFTDQPADSSADANATPNQIQNLIEIATEQETINPDSTQSEHDQART